MNSNLAFEDFSRTPGCNLHLAQAGTSRSSVRVQLSEGVRSFQVLPYGSDLRGGGAVEDIDVECYLPPDVNLQVELMRLRPAGRHSENAVSVTARLASRLLLSRRVWPPSPCLNAWF